MVSPMFSTSVYGSCKLEITIRNWLAIYGMLLFWVLANCISLVISCDHMIINGQWTSCVDVMWSVLHLHYNTDGVLGNNYMLLKGQHHFLLFHYNTKQWCYMSTEVNIKYCAENGNKQRIKLSQWIDFPW